ncbi:hypothetical protein N9D78_00940 [Flavobacteriales bacterium]|nr:hypothetical protein [Flavobacteriales bacterium]
MRYTLKGNFGKMDFVSDEEGKAFGSYQKSGSITGTFTHHRFEGTWQNKGLEGLVEFSITEGILEGNWKKGMEPGPMRSKWKGEVVFMEASEGSENIDNTVAVQEDFKKEEDTHSIPSDEVILEEKSSISSFDLNEERDELYEKSLSIAIEGECISYTILQSQLLVGANRSKRIIDQLKEAGIIENDPIGGTDLHSLRDEHKRPVKEDCTEDEMKILFKEARDLVMEEQRASASLLQRKLKLSYNLAAQLMDELESARIISPYDVDGPRSVLVGSLQELKNRAAEEKQAARLAAIEEREERKRISEEKKLERERLIEEKRLAKEAAERQWHCLIKFSYIQEVDVRGAKPSRVKSTFKYCFDDEPSDYDIERVVTRWVDDLDREIDEARLQFDELLSWRRLKVVKACSQSELEELGYFM